MGRKRWEFQNGNRRGKEEKGGSYFEQEMGMNRWEIQIMKRRREGTDGRFRLGTVAYREKKTGRKKLEFQAGNI